MRAQSSDTSGLRERGLLTLVGLGQRYLIGRLRSGSGPRLNTIWTEAKINIRIESFSLVCDFALYIFSLLDVVSIFRVQSKGPIRSCNKNITMTTHSLNVGCELCGSRRLCVIGNNAGKSICERYLFLSKRKSCRALNSTKSEKLIPKIATLRQGGLTSMHLCCLWGAQNRSV